MVLEIAEVIVKAGHEQAFIGSVRQGQALFMETEGYISHELRQSLEEPTRFVLLVQWASLEAHTVNFRESDRFPRWRGYISGHFAEPPKVQHFIRHEV